MVSPPEQWTCGGLNKVYGMSTIFPCIIPQSGHIGVIYPCIVLLRVNTYMGSLTAVVVSVPIITALSVIMCIFYMHTIRQRLPRQVSNVF